MSENEMKAMREALEAFQKVIDITKASGSEKYNHIQELRLIDRKGCTDMFGRPKRDGLFVRPIWSDNPDRSDGYYDICVEGDSPWGAIVDVFDNLRTIF